MFSHDVEMFDGTTYKVKKLLAGGKSNYKINKSDAAGVNIITQSLSLAPATASGFNLCPSASAECIASCIFTSGQASIFPRMILPARIAKARFLRLHKIAFRDRLERELTNALKTATRKGAKLAVRLNVFSDVQWEKEMPGLFDAFPDIQFYDYTKIVPRMMKFLKGELPANYHLTFSWSGRNKDKCINVLNNNGNVAIPFNTKRTKPLPDSYMGFPVIDGDLTDLRMLDPQGGYIVGLRAKGKGRNADQNSEFIVNVNINGGI